jgi:hypothetical protein
VPGDKPPQLGGNYAEDDGKPEECQPRLDGGVVLDQLQVEGDQEERPRFPALTAAIMALAAVRLRRRKIESVTSGCRARR